MPTDLNLNELVASMVASLFTFNDLDTTRTTLALTLEQFPAESETDDRILELRGCIYFRDGNLDAAIEYLNRALQARPDDAGLLSNIGTVYDSAKRFEEAVQCYQRALSMGFDIPVISVNLGNTYWAMGKRMDALLEYRRAVAVDDNLVMAHRRIADVLAEMGMFHEAIATLEKIIQLSPKDAYAYHAWAVAELSLFRDPSIAATLYEKAIELGCNHPFAYTNYGISLLRLGKVDKALEVSKCAVEKAPDSPQCKMNLGLIQLVMEDWEEGFRNSEYRLHITPEMGPTTKVPNVYDLWDGQASLEGKTIFIRHEQGFGDTIQYIRFMQRLRELGAVKLILESLEGATDLFRQNQIMDEYIPWIQAQQMSVFADYQIMMGSLPYLLQIRPDVDSYWRGPYLQPNAELVAQWQSHIPPNDKLLVGVVWRGSPRHVHDRVRSTSLAYFESLADVDGVQLVSLQVGSGVEQIGKFGRPIFAIRQDRTWGDTAAIIQHMDLIISVDTGIVHLAGAMGKPCWVLVANPCDWRWGLSRRQSVWYPHTKIFRQQRFNDWSPVFQQVEVALQEFVQAHVPV